MEQKITGLFSLRGTFENLRFVWFDTDRCSCEVHLRQYLLGIQRYIQFDRPPLQLLGRIAPTTVLPHRPETAPLRSVTAAPSQLREALCMSIILIALIFAAVGGGGLILSKRRLQLRLDILAAPLRSVLTVPSLP